MMRSTLLALSTALIASFLWGCGSNQECEKQVKDLKAQIANLKTEYEKRIEQLESENEMMAGRLDEMDDLVSDMKKQQKLAEEREELVKNILAKFKDLIEEGTLNVKIRKGKILLQLRSAVLFKPGQAELSKKGQQTLGQIAPVLAEIEDREFQVAGHTDNVPIKKSEFSSNWELSTARAVSVVTFLQEKGVPPESLSAAGYSQYQPVAKNVPGKGKAANRRIEIVLMPNLDELPNLKKLEKMLE